MGRRNCGRPLSVSRTTQSQLGRISWSRNRKIGGWHVWRVFETWGSTDFDSLDFDAFAVHRASVVARFEMQSRGFDPGPTPQKHSVAFTTADSSPLKRIRNDKYNGAVLAQPAFRTEDCFKRLTRSCVSRFWRDRTGMFIRHCASANAVPMLMRT